MRKSHLVLLLILLLVGPTGLAGPTTAAAAGAAANPADAVNNRAIAKTAMSARVARVGHTLRLAWGTVSPLRSVALETTIAHGARDRHAGPSQGCRIVTTQDGTCGLYGCSGEYVPMGYVILMIRPSS